MSRVLFTVYAYRDIKGPVPVTRHYRRDVTVRHALLALAFVLVLTVIL